ncbi:hypothetical protein BV22DRAFT_1129599 [Leucogyrophana mollusca]|uniref:Uncharacterized protein n=1 Tax=Leucogyrophana mollusca TaxID=85980 RepID=A0ACB8BJH4_9AGAM|nr:hypothetical protein BV22DRAFT_1129599 [Leucogyrophana mollusca]
MSHSLSTPPPNDFKHKPAMNTNAPRQLRLVDANIPVQHSPGPASAPLTSPSSRLNAFYKPLDSPGSVMAAKATRRQSSISYFSSRDETPSRPGAHRRGFSRSISNTPDEAPRDATQANRESLSSASSSLSESRPRPPLTLTEKHADLLQFIAQKEAKCLELRSQLAVHEAELSQLKRKWERIVNRGFERDSASGEYGVALSSGNGQSGAMLDGIKEGVQGVGRLIAAGLSDLSSPPSSTQSGIVPKTGHATQQSDSSVSTTSTAPSSFTRLSLSSASSVWEEPESSLLQESEAPQAHANDSADAQRATRMHRRRSRDCSQSRSYSHAATSSISTSTAVDLLMRSPTSPSLSLPLNNFPVSSPPPADPPITSSKQAKRESLRASAFPPPSSMPGLGSLAVVGGSVPPVSSWVGSVGKKWEELQRGPTFTKNQKRASVLFADVSQSIASALSPSPGISPSPGTSPLSSASSLSTPSSSLTEVPVQTAACWLEDDEETVHGAGALGSVMIPSKSAQPAGMTTPSKPVAAQTVSSGFDDDDWNW